MSITLTAFLEQLEAICATKPDYRIGGSGTDGTCDCIGLIIGAVRRVGGSWTGIHGSNYAARKQMADFGEIKTADLFVGEVMFENIAYIMAKHAHSDQVPDTPDEWLENFNTFSIYQILPQLIELWGLNVQTEVEARKNLAKVSG